MPGLPFVSLSEAIDAEDRAMIEDQNARVQVNIAEMRTGTRPWMEFNNAPSQPAAPDLSQADPMTVLQTLGKTALDNTLKQSQAARAMLQKSIEPDLALLRQKAQLDIQALQDESGSGLAGDDFRAFQQKKEQRLKDLELSYRKKELDIQSKIRPDLDKLDLGEQEAKDNTALQILTNKAKMDQTAIMGREAGWSDYEIRRQQLRVLGLTLPAERAPSREQTAYQEMQAVQKLYDRYQGILSNYARDTRELRGSWRSGWAKLPATNQWMEYDDVAKKYVPLTSPEKATYLNQIEAQVTDLRPRLLALQQRVLGDMRKLPSLGMVAQTPTPLAQTVTQPAGGKPLSEAQALAFLQAAGGDKEQARELARKQGYEIR